MARRQGRWMRLVRFREGSQESRVGLLTDEGIETIAGAADLDSVLAGAGVEALAGAARGELISLENVTLLAPIARPSKVICVGRNYPEHARETGSEVPTEPLIFSKFPSAITGPTDPIVLPAVAPRRVDYEAELAVVIGRGGRDVAEASAMDHVAGFMAANDVTARDWQLKRNGGQWLLGKTFDTFLPLGPALVTRDEVDDLGAVRVRCLVDGEELQNDVVASMMFSIPELIAHVSRVVTLVPGDLLLTGTPAGVGMGRTPPRWLQPGEVVETIIEGVGTLTNPVREADGAL
jgi:2-keto-4-pentenoate hydratase/2-oxohepta-3-ene-1,7-dioic acid hydratase in catechol pathway